MSAWKASHCTTTGLHLHIGMPLALPSSSLVDWNWDQPNSLKHILNNSFILQMCYEKESRLLIFELWRTGEDRYESAGSLFCYVFVPAPRFCRRNKSTWRKSQFLGCGNSYKNLKQILFKHKSAKAIMECDYKLKELEQKLSETMKVAKRVGYPKIMMKKGRHK